MTEPEAASPALPLLAPPDLPPSVSHGVLLVDKPKDWSSFRVVGLLRRVLGMRKIGHAGTLDPMATGLLICLAGRQATKQMDRFMGMPKRYTGTLRLGQTTPSYDAETEVEARVDASGVTDAQLEAALAPFRGDIEQRAPMYSAVKIGGERLYKKARRGETIERPPRAVHVSRFDVTEREGDDVSFVVDCSKGTYIRSLAHDLGQALGVGAHLVALRRTHIGAYCVDDAWTAEALLDAAERAREEGGAA